VAKALSVYARYAVLASSVAGGCADTSTGVGSHSISVDGSWLEDESGRTLILRGVNLGGSSKVPYEPNGATHIADGFFDYRYPNGYEVEIEGEYVREPASQILRIPRGGAVGVRTVLIKPAG
jgi:hypothetical protein